MDTSRINHNANVESTKLASYVCGLIAVAAWGASFISTKVLLNHGLNAVEIYIYRFALAYLVTLLVCPRPFKSNTWSDELKFMLCGICGGSVYFIAENTALLYTFTSNVSLITSTSPLITILLLGVFYKGERISRGAMIGSILAFLGVGCVIFNSSVLVKLNPLGDLLALLSAICWAVYTIILRPLNAMYSTWFVTRKTFFYGVITAMPFMAFNPQFVSPAILLEPAVWINILFLGLIPSTLAYLMWAVAVKRLGAMTASNLLYLMPVVTLVLSMIILNENVSWIGITGCILIIGGLMFGDMIDRRRLNTRNNAK